MTDYSIVLPLIKRLQASVDASAWLMKDVKELSRTVNSTNKLVWLRQYYKDALAVRGLYTKSRFSNKVGRIIVRAYKS